MYISTLLFLGFAVLSCITGNHNAMMHGGQEHLPAPDPRNVRIAPAENRAANPSHVGLPAASSPAGSVGLDSAYMQVAFAHGVVPAGFQQESVRGFGQWLAREQQTVASQASAACTSASAASAPKEAASRDLKCDPAVAYIAYIHSVVQGLTGLVDGYSRAADVGKVLAEHPGLCMSQEQVRMYMADPGRLQAELLQKDAADHVPPARKEDTCSAASVVDKPDANQEVPEDPIITHALACYLKAAYYLQHTTADHQAIVDTAERIAQDPRALTVLCCMANMLQYKKEKERKAFFLLVDQFFAQRRWLHVSKTMAQILCNVACSGMEYALELAQRHPIERMGYTMRHLWAAPHNSATYALGVYMLLHRPWSGCAALAEGVDVEVCRHFDFYATTFDVLGADFVHRVCALLSAARATGILPHADRYVAYFLRQWVVPMQDKHRICKWIQEGQLQELLPGTWKHVALAGEEKYSWENLCPKTAGDIHILLVHQLLPHYKGIVTKYYAENPPASTSHLSDMLYNLARPSAVYVPAFNQLVALAKKEFASFSIGKSDAQQLGCLEIPVALYHVWDLVQESQVLRGLFLEQLRTLGMSDICVLRLLERYAPDAVAYRAMDRLLHTEEVEDGVWEYCIQVFPKLLIAYCQEQNHTVKRALVRYMQKVHKTYLLCTGELRIQQEMDMIALRHYGGDYLKILNHMTNAEMRMLHMHILQYLVSRVDIDWTDSGSVCEVVWCILRIVEYTEDGSELIWSLCDQARGIEGVDLVELLQCVVASLSLGGQLTCVEALPNGVTIPEKYRDFVYTLLHKYRK